MGIGGLLTIVATSKVAKELPKRSKADSSLNITPINLIFVLGLLHGRVNSCKIVAETRGR